MRAIFSLKWISAIILVVAITAVIVFFGNTPYSETKTIGRDVKSFEQLQERFVSLAEKKGAPYAFVVLKGAELPPQTDLHLLGHAVGDVLYQQKGVDGIADCTQDFRNACSHAIVIGALNEFGGQKALSRIRDACMKAPGGKGAYTMCFHGLGHGVFAYYGYDIPKAIDFCKKTGTPAYHDEEFTQCVGGMVMELVGGGGHDHDTWLSARAKYISSDAPLALCLGNLIPDRARTMCLTYSTSLLFQSAGLSLGMPNPEQFPAAFHYCDTIPTTEQSLRDACFGGFGKEFIPLAGARDIRSVDSFTDDQYLMAIGWCAMADVQDGRSACMDQELASVFWGGENDSAASFRLCSLVGDARMKESCFEELASEIGQYTDGNRKTSLCAQLPEKLRDTCTASTS